MYADGQRTGVVTWPRGIRESPFCDQGDQPKQAEQPAATDRMRIKCVCEGQYRAFSFDKTHPELLLGQVVMIYEAAGIGVANVTYEDEEGDHVAICHVIEVEEALRVASLRDPPALRLFVQRAAPFSQPERPSGEEVRADPPATAKAGGGADRQKGAGDRGPEKEEDALFEQGGQQPHSTQKEREDAHVDGHYDAREAVLDRHLRARLAKRMLLTHHGATFLGAALNGGFRADALGITSHRNEMK
jgi:hypothetical protein